MATDEEAQKAVAQFNGNNFMERSIVVNEAKPQEKRERSQYREKGGYGSRGGRR
jgi:RNA recognition motif-containing protein